MFNAEGEDEPEDGEAELQEDKSSLITESEKVKPRSYFPEPNTIQFPRVQASFYYRRAAFSLDIIGRERERDTNLLLLQLLLPSPPSS